MVKIKTIELNLKGKRVKFADITNMVKDAIKESKIKDGICVVISPHTTCSVYFEEYSHDKFEDGTEYLQYDLNSSLKKIVPDHDDSEQYNYPGKAHYEAVESWPNASEYLPNGDKTALWNGDAHIKSTIIGSSETFAVENNKLSIGKTGYIYFVDFDKTRSRIRKCKIVIIGD